MKVNAYATIELGKELKPYTYELGPLPDDYVDVKVTHSGVCYTDVAASQGELQAQLPLVGGHEVAGIIHAVGKNVTNFKVGDRVGCHNVRSCCQTCSPCLHGFTNVCKRMDWLAVKEGGFGEYVRMQSYFVYILPESLPSEYAASLMCAGSTMWASLRESKARPGDRVAILGIGGLGHIGLQFARAFGCDVTAISTSRAKEEEAKGFGAHHFLALKEEAELKKFEDYFDFIIITSPSEIEFKPLVQLLRFQGTIVLAGVPGESFTIPCLPALMKGLRTLTVSGCSRAEQVDMIEFADKHKIYPKIETLPWEKINEAFEKVKKNTQRMKIWRNIMM